MSLANTNANIMNNEHGPRVDEKGPFSRLLLLRGGGVPTWHCQGLLSIVIVIIIKPRVDGVEGGHEHEGKLDSEEDGDDDDQHQRCVVCVSLSLVLPEIGHDDHDDDNVNEMGRCDGCEMVGEVNQETPPDDTTCFPNWLYSPLW